MTDPSLPSALDIDDHAVVVDATYFVIRALRNQLRRYPQPAVSPESPERAFVIARLALDEIQASEGADITNIPPDRVRAYIEVLEALSRKEFGAASGEPDVDRAQDLLDQLRADHPFE